MTSREINKTVDVNSSLSLKNMDATASLNQSNTEDNLHSSKNSLLSGEAGTSSCNDRPEEVAGAGEKKASFSDDKTTEKKKDASVSKVGPSTTESVAAIKPTKVKAPRKPREKKEGEKTTKKKKDASVSNVDAATSEAAAAVKPTKVKAPRKPKEKKEGDKTAAKKKKESIILSSKGDSTTPRSDTEYTASTKPVQKAEGLMFAKKTIVNDTASSSKSVASNICDTIIREIVEDSSKLSQPRNTEEWIEKASKKKKKRVAKDNDEPPLDSSQVKCLLPLPMKFMELSLSLSSLYQLQKFFSLLIAVFTFKVHIHRFAHCRKVES